MLIQPPDDIAIEQQPTTPIAVEKQEEVDRRPTLPVAVEQPEDVEQQPTTPIAVEKQAELDQRPTIPVVAKRRTKVGRTLMQIALAQQKVAEQTTQAVVVVQDKTEEQPTQSIVVAQDKTPEQPTQTITVALDKTVEQTTQVMVVVQHFVSKHQLRWLIPVLLCLVLSGGIALGVAALYMRVPQATTTHKVVVPRKPVQNTKPVVPLAINLATQFMHAMMQKDWAAMWWMLDPDAQMSWQGEQDFMHFEQAKFGALKFISYKMSAASVQQSWLDPDTTQVYSSATVMHISLVATAPSGLLSAPSNLALDTGLFNNTLFAITNVNGVWQVLVAGPADLEAPILVPASPPAVKLLVPIFMYHHISNKPTHNVLDYGLTVTTTDFEQQMNWLQQQGFHSIDQTELFDAFYYGKVLPPHPIILTFDDGYEDAYTDALPVLQAHHYRGVFYIITGLIGGNYMTWEQVYKLYQDGMQISSHTVHHVNVGQPPYPDTTQEELTVSKQKLESILGQPVQFFCYPSGEPFHNDTVAEQQVVLKDLFEDGYVSATLDPFSIFSAVQNAQLPYELNRVRVSGGEPLSAYMGILNYTLQQGALQLQGNP